MNSSCYNAYTDDDVELRQAGRILVYNPYKCIWEYATIVESLGTVAKVKVEGASLWVESDSEELRPFR